MTTTARDIAPQIDPAKALAAIGCDPASNIVRIKGGWDTLIWRFETPDGKRHSLRVYWLPDREDSCNKEAAALLCCESAAFPAPRVEVASRFEDLPVLVLSWVPGYPLLTSAERRPWHIWRLAHLMGETQARLHDVRPPDEFAVGAPASWTSLVEPGYETLAEEIMAYRPAASVLIHMDFHPNNIIVDGGRLTGVLDWAGAAAGDPRADLARTEVTLETAPVPPGPLKPVFGAIRKLILKRWREGYRSVRPLPDYGPFRSWAGASLLREVSRVMGRPDVWGDEAFVEQLHAIARNG